MSNFYDDREIRSAQQREEVLTKEILAQLTHAKQHAPAYGEILADLDIASLASLDDLVRIPVTRKSALVELQKSNPPFGGFTAFEPGELAYTFVSPGPINDPETKRPNFWRFGRSVFAAGIRQGDLVHNSFSYHMTPAGSMTSSGCHAVGATVIPGGVGQTDQQLETIASLKPTAYIGTPSFLKILVEKAEETGTDISSIQNALVSGEAFPPSVRSSLAERGINAVQAYGTADLGLVAYESSATSGLILDEDVFVEIVTPGTGERVANGEIGEVLVTSLNPDYPLIRFATGDMSAFMDGTSDCGRTNQRIKGWLGRADQTAKVRGMFVRPEQIAQLTARFPEISRARLVIDWVNEADTMKLYCETAQAADDLRESIAGAVRDICKVRGEVELCAPDSLAKDGLVIEDIRKYD